MATKGEDGAFPSQRANAPGSHLCVSQHSDEGSPGAPPSPGWWGRNEEPSRGCGNGLRTIMWFI